MCGGGTQTTTQQVTIPPEVMARYNSVNARAEGVASTPFQQYGSEFVAPLNETQQQGIQATGQASQSAQPYYQMGTGLTLAGTQAVGQLTPDQINTYMNPYIQGVVDPTVQALQQQQGQQLSQQQAEAIKGGAFGGERSGIQRAMLQGQQDLATGQAIAPLYAQGYQQAVSTAAGQQGVQAQDLARLMQSGQQIAGLGTAAQAAGLQGAQAQIAAGTLGQQTQQAQDTALYQQFLQERGYPYQQAQFLANIAMGTGALSGSTTTTESPAGFFSDRRLKENVKVVGKTNDGQPIYRYNYKGDPKTQLGLIAQDVEKHHPEAVGESQGYKTVDYKKATDDSVRHHRAYGGGVDVNAFGGAVTDPGSYAGGGLVDSTDLSAILAQQKNFFGPYGKGLVGEGQVGGASGIPAASLAVPKLVTAGGLPQQQRPGLSQAIETGKGISDLYKLGKEAKTGIDDMMKPTAKPAVESAAPVWANQNMNLPKQADMKAPDAKPASSDTYDPNVVDSSGQGWFAPGEMNRGGVVPRGYALGGEINPYGLSADPMADVVQEGTQKAPELTKPGQAPGVKSPMSDVKDAVGLAGSVASAGSAIAQFLPMLLSLSDERLKHDKEKVGELFDGQPVYRYHLGDGATQMGLLAQNVEKDHPEAVHETSNGVKMVDYDAATRDAANDRHGYAFGGMPRQAFADGSDVAAPDQPTSDPREMVAELARQKGLSVNDAMRLVNSESGFKTNPGDEGSSGGLWQMHVAGVSDKYPNPGLGDDYFKARQPDLAAKLSPVEKVAYLSDPNNQRDISDFATDHIAKNGAGAWTQARNQGLFGLSPTGVRAYAPDQPQGEAQQSIGAALKAGNGPEASGVLGSIQKALPTQKDSSGKESTNWEKVLIPLLSGVGSALSSTRNTLGGALGEGLLGGISGYQNVSKMQADIPKTEAETQAQLADVDRTNMMTRAAAAGLLNVTFTKGVGVQVFTKDSPFPLTITDKEGRPLPGAEEMYNEIRRKYPVSNYSPRAKAAEQAAFGPNPAVAGEPAAPGAAEKPVNKDVQSTTGGVDDKNSDPVTFIPKPVPIKDWSATVEMPKDFSPKGQSLIMGPYVKPEDRERAAIRANEQVSALQNKALGAPDTQLVLDKLSKDLGTVNRDKFTATGPTADMRNQIAARLGDAARFFGMKEPIDANDTAAFEGIQKGTSNLGLKSANSVTNSRIPFDLVRFTTEANPKMANSPLGAAMLTRNVEQGVQLERDKAQFFANYLRDYGHIEGAQKAFETINPSTNYVNKGVLKATEDVIPQAQRDYLSQYISDNPKKKADAMRKFDDNFGFKGSAKILLGE